MLDVAALLARQAEWQRGRRALTWAEKLRLAESVIEDVRRLRNTGTGTATMPHAGGSAPTEPRGRLS